MKKVEVPSYFAVEILTFGHVTAFWIITHVKIVQIDSAAYILIPNQHLFDLP